MGGKRSFKEADPSADRGEAGGHRGKKPKTQQQGGKEDGGINWVKKRARDIERRFQRDSNLPANVQKDLERELAAHKSRIAEEKDKKRRSRMISKYHMVRFFERKKAIRLAKQLRSRLKETTDPAEIEALNADLHIAEVDIRYALYFPFLETYISLYGPSSADKSDDKSTAKLALHAERPSLWSTVEKAMEEGEEALEKLRDRRPAVDADAEPSPEPPSRPTSAAEAQKSKTKAKQSPPADQPAQHSREGKPKGSNGAKTRGHDAKNTNHNSAKHEEAGESDDGGFFEEG